MYNTKPFENFYGGSYRFSNNIFTLEIYVAVKEMLIHRSRVFYIEKAYQKSLSDALPKKER